jgi:hypothetical protein
MIPGEPGTPGSSPSSDGFPAFNREALPEKGADVIITKEHGMYLFRPTNGRARRWLEANYAGEWQIGALAVFPDHAPALAVSLQEAGFTVE